MPNQILVPKNLAANHGKRLFTLIGLNREARRKTKLGEAALIQSVLDPNKRLWRFWCNWWPFSHGATAPQSFQSIDLLLLLRYEPGLRKASVDESSLLEELEGFDLSPEKIRESISSDERDKFEFSYRPFSVWRSVREDLFRWDTLSEEKQCALVDVTFALDGISGGEAFTSAAKELQPACLSLFETVQVQSGAFDDKPDESDDPPVILEEDTSEQALAKWTSHWCDLIETAELAKAGPILIDLVDRAQKSVAALKVLAENEPPENLRGEAVIAQMRESLQRLDSALTLTGFPALVTEGLDTLIGVVQGSAMSKPPRERVAFLAELEQTIVSLNQSAVQLDAHQEVRQKLASSRSGIESQLLEAPPGRRIALLRSRNEYFAKIGDLDIEVAQCVEDAARVVNMLRGEAREDGATAAIPTGATEGTPESPAATSAASEPPATTSIDKGKAKLAISPEVVESKAPQVPTPVSIRADAETAKVPISSQSPEAGQTDSESETKHVSTPFPHPENPATAANDDFSDENGERCRPIWRALQLRKPALAYQIACALEKLNPELRLPPVPLLKAVTLAGGVRFSHGEVSQALAASYELFDRTWFETGPTEWRDALSILLVAATLRPSLVSPSTGATAVMRYAHPPRKIHELRQLVVEVAERLQGLNLGPSAFREVGGIAGWEKEWKSYLGELADWRNRAGRFSMRFGRANDVWRQLISNQGRIGSLLSSLEQKDPPPDAEVAKNLSDLSDPNEFRRTINHIDRGILGARRGEDIHAGALKQLEERTGDALELVQRRLDLRSRMPQEGNFVLKVLEGFRNGYGRLRPEVEAELNALQANSSPWQLTSSAVASMRAALGSLDELLVGQGRSAEQSSNPEKLLSFPLLQCAQVDLDERWRPLQSAEVVLNSAVALVDVAVDWRVAFNARMARGDAAACREIVGELEESSDIRVDQFRRELDQGLDAWRNKLRVRLAEARKRLESALAYGYVEEPERGNLDAELASLESRVNEIERFLLAENRIEEIVASLRRHKTHRLEVVAREVNGLQLPEGSSLKKKLNAVIESGDVFTANEYIQRIRAGEQLPDETGTKADAFRSFFPERAGKIEAMLNQGKTGYQEIKNALENGQSIDCLDFSSVGSDQRNTARSMLDAWFALKRGQAGHGSTKSVSEVIEGLGFLGAKVTVRQGRDRMECDLVGQIISDRNICPVPTFGSQAQGRYRVIIIWGQPADEDLPRIVGDSASGQPTVVLYLGRQTERGRRELARVARSTGASFLVLDEILMLHLCAESGSRLGTFFACALPFSCVRPFVTTSGLVPPEMFFGRTGELKAVTDRNGRCFVYGGRQLGKTALLRAVERTFHQPNQRQFAVWIDLKAVGIGSVVEVGAVWAAIRRKLLEIAPEFFGSLPEPVTGRKQSIDRFLDELRQRFVPARGARLLLLLDEADRFLEQDSRTEYHETGRLKNLMDSTDRGFKVVFAGLHNVLRTTEQANHPLAHFGDPIEIGPFTGASEWNEARSMIRGPLLAAGYELTSDDLIVRILAQTNYYPVLIQLYGEQLIRILHDANRQRFTASEGPRYPVSDALVDEAYRERSLREAIRARFQYTLQLDQRYEVIAYALAWALAEQKASFSSGVDAKELRTSAVYWWGDGFRGVSDHEFRIILDEMVGLGVLRHVGERMYSLRNPNLLRLLGTLEDIETVLTRAREAPVEFEPSVFRAPDPVAESGPRRSPLTFTQESSFLVDKHGVSLIVGAEAGGVSELRHFLTRRIPGLQWRTGITNRNEFGKLLDARREEGNTVLVLPTEASWGESWIRQALEKVRKLTSQDRRMRIVFVADPMMLWQLMPAIAELEELGLEVVPLKPWNERFLRQWLGDIQVAGDDAALRQELSRLTGLWPGALLPLPAQCHQLGDLVAHLKMKFELPESRAQLLNNLGLPPGEARSAMILLQTLPDESLESLQAIAPDMDVPVNTVQYRMRWGELLQLVQSTGKDCWRVDPLLDTLLRSVSNA